MLIEIQNYRKNELEDVCEWVVGGKEYFFGPSHNKKNIYEPTRNVLLEQDVTKIHNPHERVCNNRMNVTSSRLPSIRFASTLPTTSLTSTTSTTSISETSTENAILNINILMPKQKK